MNLFLKGFDAPIPIHAAKAAELSIESKVLLSRIVASLKGGEGESASEPYLLVDSSGGKLKPKEDIILIDSPFSLPWEDRRLMGSLYQTIEARLREEDEIRLRLERNAEDFRCKVSEFGLSFQSDYSFAVEWDLKKYLRAFGFKADAMAGGTLIDSLIQFIALAFDVGYEGVIIFVNLQKFLSDSELEMLLDQVFFYKSKVLLLESTSATSSSSRLEKHRIDQGFLED